MTHVTHGGVTAGGAIAFLLSAAGSTSVLVAELLALLVWWQALEGISSTANDVSPVDMRCVAVHTALVLSAAAENAGVSHTHQAVTALVALAVAQVAVKGTECGAHHVLQP